MRFFVASKFPCVSPLLDMVSYNQGSSNTTSRKNIPLPVNLAHIWPATGARFVPQSLTKQ